MLKLGRLNPIIELLVSSPGRVHKISAQGGSAKPKIKQIVRLARENRVPVSLVPKASLDRMDPHHQGVIAVVASVPFVSLDEILRRQGTPFLVLLDEIEDPQNLGAVLRSAEGAGVHGIVLPERRSAGLSETVYQVSAGAVAHIPVTRVKNLSRTMERLRDSGIWLVGAEGEGEALWHDFDYTQPVALVFGSEGKGLRPLIRQKCDRVLSLPLFGRTSSLNVAAAAVVFMYEVVRQRMTLNE